MADHDGFNPLSLVAAPINGVFNFMGAKKQANAAKHAADLESKAAADALAFQRSEASRDQANAEATRHANYDQWAAREGRLSSLGQMLGLGPRDIPGYVPMPTGAPPVNPSGMAPQRPPSVAQAVGAPPGSAPPADFQAQVMQRLQGKPFNQQALLDLEPWLNAVGSQLTPPNAVGDRTKILDPSTGQWVRVGFGEGHPVWIPQGTGSGPRAAGMPSAIAAMLMPQQAPMTTPRVPIAPGVQMPYPGSLASYLRG